MGRSRRREDRSFELTANEGGERQPRASPVGNLQSRWLKWHP